ncbi:MAG: 4'-phosphopantetheinyl transferase family protein [Candidatus Binataceae bacterium]
MDLGLKEVHVWQADLEVSARMLDELQATLSGYELARAARFHFPRDRARFIAAHAIVRNILGGYLIASPAMLEFSSNEHGKPALAGNWRNELSFNLSHSGERVVVALTRDREVGVDVEEYVPSRADAAVAEHYFSPSEVARLHALPESIRPRAFFNCWTRKEAYIKARGLGLAIPLDSFDVSLAPDEPATLLRTSVGDDVGTWQLRHLELGDRYIGALVASGTGWSFDLRHWTGPRAGIPTVNA